MKYSKKILLGSVLWAVANGVFASAANLRVSGTILPASCIPSFPAGGTFDLGAGAIKSLSETTNTEVGAHNFRYDITCDSPMPVVYRVIDNRADSRSTLVVNYLGLGRQGTTGIGYARAYLWAGFRADGQPASILTSSDAGLSWRDTPPGNFFQTRTHYAYTRAGGTAPQAFSHYEGVVRIIAHVRPTSELDASQEIVLDGSITMEVMYL